MSYCSTTVIQKRQDLQKGVEWGQMNIVVTILAVGILAFGVLFSQRNATLRTLKREVTDSTEVLSEQQEEATPTEEPRPEADRPPDKTPTPTKVVIKVDLSDYRYPNSEILSSSENALSLKSFEDAKTITNWYKEKIVSEGMNVKTFVETKANNNVLNKLVGADGKKEIRVEIKKTTGSSLVEIEVSLKTTS